jgi:DNA replication protein DnaC
MPEQALRLPAALPASEQLAEFKRYSIAHRILKEADNSLWQRIQEPGGASLIFVYGPTGVGKTTLRQHITSRLIEGAEGAPESEAHQLPALALEAAAPESGNFHWGHFFRQALGELEAPFLKDKVEYAANTAYFDRAGNYVINLRATAQDLRLSVEQSLRYRRPRAVIIDEAQHLTKISSGRRLQEQMDVLKSLANQTGSLLVLIGTYELLTFQGLSGQLSRPQRERAFSALRIGGRRSEGLSKRALRISAAAAGEGGTGSAQALGVLLREIDRLRGDIEGLAGAGLGRLASRGWTNGESEASGGNGVIGVAM